MSNIYNLNSFTYDTYEYYKNIYSIMNINIDEQTNEDLNLYRTQYEVKNKLINYSNGSSILLPTIYSSLHNKQYKKIFYDVFNNHSNTANKLIMSYQQNLFFNKFMGVKYILTNNRSPYGYKKIKEFNNLSLYENNNVYSLGFASPNLLNYSEYNNLSFIEKLLAYQNNIIISDKSNNSDFDFNYEKIKLDYEIKKQRNLAIETVNDHYIVHSLSYGNLNLSLNEPIKNKSLIIRFRINNTSKSRRTITINNIRDSLTSIQSFYYNDNKTFDYVISSNEEIKELNINFYKGIYDISDIEAYAVDNNFFNKNNTTSLIVNFDKTKGDDIYGSINVKESGYFIFTIPYDKGYTAYVDNKKVEIEKVNVGFIGFKIDSGKHNIHLTFSAPYAKFGRIVSLFGIISLVILYIYEKQQEKDI